MGPIERPSFMFRQGASLAKSAYQDLLPTPSAASVVERRLLLGQKAARSSRLADGVPLDGFDWRSSSYLGALQTILHRASAILRILVT